MAALITHHLFGQSAIADIPDAKDWSTGELEAFLIGQQGPDPFFYAYLSANGSVCRTFGDLLHSRKINRTFERMRAIVSLFEGKDRAIAHAYSLGFLAHFTLDSVVHPFVFAQQHALVLANDELVDASSEVHSVIEADLDSMMLWRLAGMTPEEIRVADVLSASDEVLDVVGRLFARLGREVYSLDIKPTDYPRAIRDFRLLVDLIESDLPLRIVAPIERLIRKHSHLQALSHRSDIFDTTPADNTEGYPWEHPFVADVTSEASFHELFDEALASYGNRVASFTSCAAAPTFTHDLNYSGIPLVDDRPVIA